MRYRRSARTAMACASLLMLALVLLGGPAGASGLADSPWPMYQHDPQHTGRSPYVGPENPAILWRYEPSQTGGLGSPVLAADGTVYIPYSRLAALNGATGALKWLNQTPRFMSMSAAVGLDGTVYAGNAIANELQAVAPDGAVDWTFGNNDGPDTQVPGAAARVVSPSTIGADGTIYFGSTNGKLYALNGDGSDKWSFITGARIDGSSPAVGDDGTIYVGSWDGNLYALEADGIEKWGFATGDWIGTSPALAGDGAIYVTSGAVIYAVNPDGTKSWELGIMSDLENRRLSSPAIGANGSIYVASSGGGLHALSSDGAPMWTFPTGVTFSTPVVDAAGVIYIGSRDKHLYAVNPDGSEKWRFSVGDAINEDIAIGPDGIYLVTSNPTGKDYALLIGQAGSSVGSRTTASVAILGGVVVAGGLGLYCTRRKVGARR